MTKYEDTVDGEWFYPKHRKFRHMCCDCSLVHIIDFALDDNGKDIKIKLVRNNRATAASRRNKKTK